MFQYQNSPIKSVEKTSGLATKQVFQYQNSPIKRKLQIYTRGYVNKVSIPK